MKLKSKILLLGLLVVFLVSGCFSGKKESALTVQLLLEDGSPLDNIELTIKSQNKTLTDKTNSEGKIGFKLPAGQYTLEGSIPLYDGTEVSISESVTVGTKDKNEFTLKLTKIGKIEISLVELVGGKPISNGIVNIDSQGKSIEINIGETGTKTIYANLGSIKITAKKSTVTSEPIEIDIKSTKVKEIIKLDYDSNPELARRKKYEVLNAERHAKISDKDGTILTDGVEGNPTSWDDEATWLGAKLANPAEKVISYIIDLEKSNPIIKVRAQFHQTEYGIDIPAKISVSVSDDKVTWSEPVEKEIPAKPTTPASTEWVEVDLTANGRYVKVSVTPRIEWVLCGEISILKPVD